MPVFQWKPIPGVCGTSHQLILQRGSITFRRREERSVPVFLLKPITLMICPSKCVWGGGGGSGILPPLDPHMISLWA